MNDKVDVYIGSTDLYRDGIYVTKGTVFSVPSGETPSVTWEPAPAGSTVAVALPPMARPKAKDAPKVPATVATSPAPAPAAHSAGKRPSDKDI